MAKTTTRSKKTATPARKTKTASKKCTLMVVSGVEGPSLYLNDYRIAGPKPWGGGTAKHEWKVDRADLKQAVEQALAGTT